MSDAYDNPYEDADDANKQLMPASQQSPAKYTCIDLFGFGARSSWFIYSIRYMESCVIFKLTIHVKQQCRHSKHFIDNCSARLSLGGYITIAPLKPLDIYYFQFKIAIHYDKPPCRVGFNGRM